MKPIRRCSTLLFLIAASASCTSAGRPDTGGQVMATSSDAKRLYIADADRGAIVLADPDTGPTDVVEVGVEPTRIARAGDRLFVSLRGERAVAVLTDEGGKLALQAKIPVGAEPFGVAASLDGTKVWVASSLSDRVDELDTASLTITRSFPVSGEPRWLAVHSSERSLYAGCARNGTIAHIELGTGNVTHVPLPLIGDLRTKMRATGDIAVTTDGKRVLVPALQVFVGDREDESSPISGWGGDPPDEPEDEFTSMPVGVDPVIIVANVDDDGAFILGAEQIVSVAAWDHASIAESKITRQFALRGYPSSVTVSPDSSLAAVTVEGAGHVVLVPVTDIPPRRRDRFTPRFGAKIPAGPGARAASFAGDQTLLVYSFIERTVRRYELNGIAGALARFDVAPEAAALVVQRSWFSIGESPLPGNVLAGRRLFYAADDGYMQEKGARLSCATCHFDGRDDGLTWMLPDAGARQTPSLAGPVSLTAPVRWEGDRITVAEDARDTSNGFMGGKLSLADAEAIQAFIDSSRDADVALKNSNEPAIARGRELFERADVGCASCHSGVRMTNGSIVRMLDMDRVKTRSLIGVAATAPYFHDGSAATLRDVLERATSIGMGNTSHLDPSELYALELYLRSL